MSHELRTPLNAIIGFSDLLQTEMFGPLGSDQYLEYAADINRSGHHLLELVNDLLDMARIEAGMVDLQEEAIDVAMLIREAVNLAARIGAGNHPQIRRAPAGADTAADGGPAAHEAGADQPDRQRRQVHAQRRPDQDRRRRGRAAHVDRR